MKIWLLSIVFITQANIPIPLKYEWYFSTHQQCADNLTAVTEAFQKELDRNEDVAHLIDMQATCEEVDALEGGNYGK